MENRNDWQNDWQKDLDTRNEKRFIILTDLALGMLIIAMAVTFIVGFFAVVNSSIGRSGGGWSLRQGEIGVITPKYGPAGENNAIIIDGRGNGPIDVSNSIYADGNTIIHGNTRITTKVLGDGREVHVHTPIADGAPSHISQVDTSSSKAAGKGN